MDNSVLERIVINASICNGKPIVRGMRITVETILEYLAAGDSFEDVLNAYPILETQDIQACSAFAFTKMYNEKIEINLV